VKGEWDNHSFIFEEDIMIEEITNLLKPVINEVNLELLAVNWLPNIKTLEVVIDKENGVDIDDCVLATKVINKVIEKVDDKLGNYTLEVVSKGVEDE